MDGDPSQEDRIRLIGRLFLYTIVTAGNQRFVQYFSHGCLVVIGTWLIAKSLLLFTLILIHSCNHWIFPNFKKAVTSRTCWGRVVIGSLVVYQTSGAGSNPVASTTVLAYAIRSIGSDQENCNSFAGKSLEKSGLFLFSTLAYRATFLL